jgi:hypothetical protein
VTHPKQHRYGRVLRRGGKKFKKIFKQQQLRRRTTIDHQPYVSLYLSPHHFQDLMDLVLINCYFYGLFNLVRNKKSFPSSCSLLSYLVLAATPAPLGWDLNLFRQNAPRESLKVPSLPGIDSRDGNKEVSTRQTVG